MFTNKYNFLKGAASFAFELIIVFCGVLLAFFVSDWRSKNIQKERYQKTIEVLHREISDFVSYGPIPVKAMEDSLQQYYQQRKNGLYPVPGHYREPRATGAPTAAWEATLASGAQEILPPDLFYELTLYYNRVESINEKFERYSIRNEEMYLFIHDDPELDFYKNGKLRKEFRVHIQILEEVIAEIKLLIEEADTLKTKLGKQLNI
ncbi:hypothetical protein QQ008_25640 [Fulvivirgaceae bacterium BMA10]|uniref:Type II secretion system protein n=1 Tax=Splendidivirga corallicola TaxID=3051826 RepID=A0ABT8KVJ6_9BACT|nr:hypothetical protein [Fulvivirgaceae bacterium BMA10]